MKPGVNLKNRIKSRALVEASKLKAHPMNFRLHPEPQRAALEAILSEVGWVQDVIVNKRTGYILNGHLRVDIAAKRGEKVPVAYVDLTPQEEKIILAALDQVGELAIVDDEQLASLLAEVEIKDAGLQAMLDNLLGEAKLDTPQTVDPGPKVPSDRSPRQLGDRKAQIKPVLYANQVALFEEALRMTGEINRGKALMQVCDFFIQANAK